MVGHGLLQGAQRCFGAAAFVTSFSSCVTVAPNSAVRSAARALSPDSVLPVRLAACETQ